MEATKNRELKHDEGGQKVFNIEEIIGVSRRDEILREAAHNRIVKAALADKRRARRERIRKRVQSIVAAFGIGQL